MPRQPTQAPAAQISALAATIYIALKAFQDVVSLQAQAGCAPGRDDGRALLLQYAGGWEVEGVYE